MTNDFVYTTFIRTTPEKVWSAITNPEFTRQYWGAHVNVSDWKKGSEWEHQNTNDGNAVRVKGKVLESIPPKRLVMTWYAPDDEGDVSTLTYAIEPAADNMVRLDVIHGSFKPDSEMAGKVSKGWPLVLSSLKSFLETGKPIDILAMKTCSDDKAA